MTVKAVTNRICTKFQDFIVNAEDPTALTTYHRDRHYLLGEKTIDVDGDGFTGFKQKINLESGEGGIYHVILIGSLHFIENQKYRTLRDLENKGGKSILKK